MAVWSLIADFFHHSTYFFIKQIIIFFDQSHTFKKELEKKEKEEKKQEEEEKKIKSMPRVLAKLDALQKEFKDREWKERLSKHPS